MAEISATDLRNLLLPGLIQHSRGRPNQKHWIDLRANEEKKQVEVTVDSGDTWHLLETCAEAATAGQLPKGERRERFLGRLRQVGVKIDG